MILKMLANNEIKRPSKKAKLSKSVNIEADKANYIRGRLKDDGSVEPLENQGSIATLSLADCLITLGEKDKKVSSGDLVNIIMID
jgi:molybdopterin biosynthesis enzyme